jgi:hypothetical protein
VYHKKKFTNKLITPFTSQLAFFWFLGTEINKSNSVAFAAYYNYNFQTQESINILKTKQNETTISRVAMQIRTNCGRNEDTK